MTINVDWYWLKDNTVIVMLASVVLITVGLLYNIIHNHNERCRKDKEKRDKIRNALKQIHDELNDTLDAIEKKKGIHYYCEHKNAKPISFLKLKFWSVSCEHLINSPEIMGVDISVNKIKDIIGYIKENNRIFEWMEDDLPLANEDGSGPRVDDNAFPNMLYKCSKMHSYQKQLRDDIPPILQKIKKVCDQLG